MVMVQNTYGTKWFLVMVRNCNFVVRNGYGAKYIWNEIAILWYEMVNYGTKWFLAMVRNCNFVVRNVKLWYEMAMVRNGYGTK